MCPQPPARWKGGDRAAPARPQKGARQATDLARTITSVNFASAGLRRHEGTMTFRRQRPLNCIRHLLAQFDYHAIEHQSITLPPRERNPDYIRTPVPLHMIVPDLD